MGAPPKCATTVANNSSIISQMFLAGFWLLLTDVTDGQVLCVSRIVRSSQRIRDCLTKRWSLQRPIIHFWNSVQFFAKWTQIRIIRSSTYNKWVVLIFPLICWTGCELLRKTKKRTWLWTTKKTWFARTFLVRLDSTEYTCVQFNYEFAAVFCLFEFLRVCVKIVREYNMSKCESPFFL
jgi:hypothetical protein